MDTVDYKEKFEKLIQRIDDLIVNGWIDEKAGKAILKDFTLESEDERIRKELISLIKETHVTDRYYDLNKMLAWLEKQAEQKPIAKFKVGDRIYDKRDSYNRNVIREVGKDYYINAFGQKMDMAYTNANFEFLEHLEDDNIDSKSVAWSEEDEIMLRKIIQYTISLSEGCEVDLNDQINWLKSIKERMQPQPKQELSEDAPTNEYVNLGLPSGTLWKTFNEDGYYKFDEAVEKFGDLLPTKEQWEELKDECKWVWKDNGYDVIGPNGNLIFLPAAGYYDGKYAYGEGMYGYYWSSIYVNESCAWSMGFGDDFLYVSKYSCNYGRSVRLVKDVY